jgi:hypothetical protein
MVEEKQAQAAACLASCRRTARQRRHPCGPETASQSFHAYVTLARQLHSLAFQRDEAVLLSRAGNFEQLAVERGPEDGALGHPHARCLPLVSTLLAGAASTCSAPTLTEQWTDTSALSA